MAKRTIDVVVGELNDKVAEGNKLLADGKPISVSFIDSFKELEKDYALLVEQKLFKELTSTSNPMLEAVKQWRFVVLRHSIERCKETKLPILFKLDERDKQINLLKFARYAHLDSSFEHRISELNQMLAMRLAGDMGTPIKEVAMSLFMSKEAKRLEGGRISNNALAKKLQEVMDGIIFGEKPLSRDVKYIEHCYARRGRNLSLTLANNSFLINVIGDVMHRIITNKEYTLNYKAIKEPEVKAVAKPEVKDTAEELSPLEKGVYYILTH